MLNSSNFNNEGFDEKELKTVEKVHYIGDLRIVGQIIDAVWDKKPIGYVIMAERTQKFKAYTVSQTKTLLSKFKFVNAKLVDDEIVNTECAMSRMPRYYPNLRVADNYGIIIIGEIVDGSVVTGYRALDNNGFIVDLSEKDLIEFNNRGMNLVNAKVVTKNGKTYISAIKNEFTKIEKSKIKEAKPKETAGFKWRKQMHVNKWLKFGALRALKWGFLGRPNAISKVDMFSRYPEGSDLYGVYLDLDREARILAKEVYTKKNGIVLSNEDMELYKKILREAKHNSIVGDEVNVDGETQEVYLSLDDQIFVFLISQFILNNKDKQKELLDKLAGNPYCYDNKVIRGVCASGYACDALKDTLAKLKKMAQDYKTDSLPEKQLKKIFKTKEFAKAVDMGQLGFTISESNRGFKFITDTGSVKTLLYLGDIIDDNYQLYKSNSRCLGDLVTIAYIEKLRKRFYDYNMDKKSIRAAIEMIIAISYLFNSRAMKLYIDNTGDKLEELGVNIPDYDEIAGIECNLPDEIKMYYSSGFNVFLNDNKYLKKEYHSKYLRYSELINYRQLGITHRIEHPMLKTELVPVVKLLTSENCDSVLVHNLIGKLRFL